MSNIKFDFHKLLSKQIKKKLGEEFLEDERFVDFFQVINETYLQYEEDYAFLERTMEISAKEIKDSYQLLKKQQAEIEEAYEKISSTKAQLEESEKIAFLSKELMKIHEELMSAQEHALMIQKALLGSTTEIIKNFKDAFILYIPKDIVSGDFYWYSQQGNYKIIIAGDCTGHGVPAAFMTIVGYNLLNEIINKELILKPNEILHKLDEKIFEVFQKKGLDFDINDGMDISILVFDEKHKSVSFAGAKNSLIFIRNQNMEFIKGSRFPIGDTRYENKIFDNHTFQYQNNDKFYIYTDGYQDQFGGEKGKKLMKNNFHSLVLENHQETMEVQHEKFKKFIKKWLGKIYEQLDDILIIGIET